MNKQLLAHIALFSVAVIYGANYSIAKEVLDPEYIQPIGFISLRILAALFLFFIIHHLWIKERVERKDLFLLFLCGVFGVAINQSFFFLGLKQTQPIHASLILTTTPILVMIISAFYLHEKLNFNRVFGILLGLSGAIMLLVQGHKVQLHGNQLVGDLLVLINSFSYGIYLVLVKKLLLKYHPFTVLKWILFIGAILVVPFGISDLMIVKWSSFPWTIWMAVVFVLLFTTFFAYLFNAFALKTVSPTVVSFYIYLQPIVASIIAILMTKDSLDSTKIISAALIFAGVFLVSKRTNVKTEKTLA